MKQDVPEKHRYVGAMVHLSVAVGRFFEALFYAILRVAGLVTLGVIAVAAALLLLFMLARRMLRRDRPEG